MSTVINTTTEEVNNLLSLMAMSISELRADDSPTQVKKALDYIKNNSSNFPAEVTEHMQDIVISNYNKL